MGQNPTAASLIGILLSFFFLSVSCAVNPVSGERELMLLSEEDEVKLGQQTDKEIVKQYGLYDDGELRSYISSLGKRIAEVSHRPNLPYQFKIMDSSVINAFAVPGGYVYFTREILGCLNSEAELAGVIGHEIGHITARHSAKQYSRAQMAQIGLGLGAILSETLSTYAGLAQAGIGMLFLSFSRDNEREADDLGVEYSSKAGYDSSQMAHFFNTLERMNPGAHQSGLPSWFSTHPNPVDRQDAVKSKTKEWQQKLSLKSPRIGQEAYLKNIDGIVYGDDPRQGYVKDNVFYHPTLLFQFPVPRGWKVQNKPSFVNMLSPNKDAAIQFGLSSGLSPEEEARTFVEKTKAVVIRSGSKVVNGFPAYWMTSQIKSQGDVLQVMSFFIEKEQKTYVFHGYSGQPRFAGYQSTFRDTIDGFKRPSDTNSLRLKPDRIRIRHAKKAGTLKQALTSFGVESEDLEKMAILNGRNLEDPIPYNTPIKTVLRGDR